MMRKLMLVYIAGPYMGKTHDCRSYMEIERNILNAREAALAVWKAGAVAICPHLNTYHFEVDWPEASADFFREADLEIVSRCDAVFLINGWKNSKGAKMEKEHAEKLGLPVFEDIILLRNWIGD